MNLTAVGRRYGRRRPWVLRGVSLELPRGSLVRVEGRNGGGKSTLLRLAAGIDTPTEGRITGRPRRTAYVPERFPAALPLTAAAYLTHMGRVHGLPRAEAARRAAEWLERFGAAGHARTPLAELSKGSSQKVAAAQALLAEPGLLVLDEAWTGLDVPARAELDRAVAERTAAGGTVLFVDHDPARLAGGVSGGCRVSGPDAHYRVEGAALVPVRPTSVASVPPVPSVPSVPSVRQGADAGPYVRIEAAGPPGSAPPPALAAEPAPGGGVRLTVPAVRSDAVLRELLTARPPWHIREVRYLP
ncbi:ATP-binding cassette domain-containing protein [Streptomyces sp. APSN-46.1]|uniref:ATP-binding cassette domain-containing protein n=1 Tax=Streptomyces sp. APSN-46.1 TaxID=2929049 RepID=UPI001FB33087|nr:ATP-binding cassette domain-containing protein [Streptomyces sp. APSN-46.1]MCJ1680525.1 ATP-binding cassette domain-containing protein [Streptomyces sp. APSN-46.1]